MSNEQYYKWCAKYKDHIKDMYFLSINTVNKNHPKNNINWSDKKNIDYFSFMLYNSSSKFISNYI